MIQAKRFIRLILAGYLLAALPAVGQTQTISPSEDNGIDSPSAATPHSLSTPNSQTGNVMASSDRQTEAGHKELFTIDDLSYDIVDGEAVVVRYSGNASYVTIPDEVEYEGKNYRVTSIGNVFLKDYDAWGRPKKKGAFQDCTSLVRITLPKGLKSIEDGGEYYSGDFNFYGTFYGCTGLTNIYLPQGLNSIGGHAFEDCTGLTSIYLPQGLNSIGYKAFSYCTGLTRIYLPQGLNSIGDYAFSDCTGLTSIYLPQGLNSIGKGAFFDCERLTSVNLPQGLNSIGENAFLRCYGLKSFSVEDGNKHYATIDGVLFNFAKDTLIAYPNAKGAIYNVPQGVNSIGISAFLGCRSLKSVNLPQGLNSIGDYAFKDCTGLTSVNLPQGLNSIGEGAFWGCTDLTNVNLPQGLTYIGDYAFAECRGLTSVNLPQGLNSIGISAFNGCKGLTSVNLPQGLNSIGYCAFYGCRGLTNINLPQGLNSIGFSAFQGCTGLTTAILPNGLTELPKDVFKDCIRLSNVTLPKTINKIDDASFDNCRGLRRLTLPKSFGSKFRHTYNTKVKELYLASDEHVDLSDFSTDWIFHVPSNLLANYQESDPGLTFEAIPNATVTPSVGDYTTAYVSNETWLVPQGIKGAMLMPEGNGTVRIDWRFQAGDVIPAGVPVLLKGTAGTSYDFPRLPLYSITPDSVGAYKNLFMAAQADGLSTAPFEANFYRLKVSPDGTKVGFYWDAPNGVAFPVKAGEVYLALPRSNYAKFKGIDLDDLETAITQPEFTAPAEAAKPQAIYTLDGRRVNATSTESLTKGIYIVNGKKVLVN